MAIKLFSALLGRLEAIGGAVQQSHFDIHGGFNIVVSHPDVNIDHEAKSEYVKVRCRRGKFPPSQTHADVDDIMTVIEGWMKEAGGCKAALMTQTPQSKAFEAMFAKDEALERHEEALDARERIQRRNQEHDLHRRARQMGVNPATLRGYETTSGKPYRTIVIANIQGIPNAGNTEESWHATLQEAQWMVREAKTDSRVGHIELEDVRPGGRIWYYDRDRSGFWKRTVHN